MTWISIFALQWGFLIKKIQKADPSKDLKYVFRDDDKCKINERALWHGLEDRINLRKCNNFGT